MSKASKQNNFRLIVEGTPDIANGYQAGLQALGKYSKHIELADNSQCEGSVEIDECTKAKYPDHNRWDYVIAYRSAAYFVEVHSAETGEVSRVLRKLQWLKDWLNREAPELNRIKANIPYYWIQSGRYRIQHNSPQFRKMINAGIKPIPKLNLP